MAGRMLDILLLNKYNLSTVELNPIGVMSSLLLLQNTTFPLLHEQADGHSPLLRAPSTLLTNTKSTIMM